MSQHSGSQKGKTLFVRGSARSSQQDPLEQQELQQQHGLNLQNGALDGEAIHKKIQGSAQNVSINSNLHQGHEVIVTNEPAYKRNETHIDIQQSPEQKINFNANLSFRSHSHVQGGESRKRVLGGRMPLKSRIGRKVGRKMMEKIEEEIDDGKYHHFSLLKKKKSVMDFEVYHEFTLHTIVMGTIKLTLFFSSLWFIVVYLMGRADRYLPWLGPQHHMSHHNGPMDNLEYRYDFDIDVDVEYLRWLQFKKFEKEHHKGDEHLYNEFRQSYDHDKHHHEQKKIEVEIEGPRGHMREIEIEVPKVPHGHGHGIEVEVELPNGREMQFEIEGGHHQPEHHQPEHHQRQGWEWSLSMPSLPGLPSMPSMPSMPDWRNWGWGSRGGKAIVLPDVPEAHHQHEGHVQPPKIFNQHHDHHQPEIDIHAELNFEHRHHDVHDPLYIKQFYGYCDSEDIRSDDHDLTNCIPCPPNTLCMRGKLHECRPGFTQVGTHCVETLRDGKPFYAEILKLLNTIDVGVRTKNHDFIDYGAQNSKIITTKEVLNLHHRQHHSSERELDSLKRELLDILKHLNDFGFGLYVRLSHDELDRLDCDTCFDTLYLEHKLLNHETVTSSWWNGLLRTRH